jgi:hypothetical protein
MSFYYNINGEEYYQAPIYFQRIFTDCPFIEVMGREDCIIRKNNKLYKLDYSAFIKREGNNLNDLIIYLKKRYEEIV